MSSTTTTTIGQPSRRALDLRDVRHVRGRQFQSAYLMHGLARPNPFFDDRTNAPCSVPRVLTPNERAAL